MASTETLSPGTVVGNVYEVESVLGAGGFGITYRTHNTQLKQHVALKEYFPRDAAIRDVDGCVKVVNAAQEKLFRWGLGRFVEEAQTLARFSHPNIVRVLQIFGAYGTAYIALEHIEGPSLQRWLLQSDRRPDQEELDAFSAALLSALEVVHRNEVLHRDIAPKNILLRADGSPVLIDFGSARQSVSSMTMSAAAIVTPHYAPYEQYLTSGQGQGAWTDIYATAATLHEIITGRPPPESPSRAMSDTYVPLAKRARGRYRAEFLEAIDWGLMTHPKDRPQTVSQWRRLLGKNASRRSGVRGLTVAARRPGRGVPLVGGIMDMFARKSRM